MVILGKDIIVTPVTAKDSNLMVGTVVTMIPEGIMSHVIDNPGGAFLHSSNSMMDIRIGTILGRLLFRIDNMGLGVHIVNTTHPIVAIPEVSRQTGRDYYSSSGRSYNRPSNY